MLIEAVQGTTVPLGNSWPLMSQLPLGPVLVNVPIKPAPAHKLAAAFCLIRGVLTNAGTVQFAGGGGGLPEPRERLLRNGMIKADFSGTFFAKAGANAKSIWCTDLTVTRM